MTEKFRDTEQWKTQAAAVSFEVALNQYFFQQATRFAQQHPTQVARLAIVKFVRMWNIWPNEASLRNWPLRLAVALGYLPILAAALLGAAKFIRYGWPYILCLAPAVYFTLLHMLFVGSIRYRQPPMLLLIVLAAGWLSVSLCRQPIQSNREDEE